MKHAISARMPEGGFSLPELMIGLAFTAMASMGAMKVMEIVAGTRKNSIVSAEVERLSQKVYTSSTRKFQGRNIADFDTRLAFSLNGSGIEYIQPPGSESELVDLLLGDLESSSSFSYKEASGGCGSGSVYHVSVCLPFGKSSRDILSLEDLKGEALWPVARKNAGGRLRVNCCPLSNLSCSEPGSDPFDSTKALYRVVSLRMAFDAEGGLHLKQTPALGETGDVSGAGFFVYFPSRPAGMEPDQVKGVTYTYYSECLSKKARGLAASDCVRKLKLSKKEFAFPLNQIMSASGVELGSSIDCEGGI